MVVKKVEFLELLGTGANQCQDIGAAQASRDDIQWRPFCALELSFHEEAAPFNSQVQLRPQLSILDKSSTPMTAHGTCVNEVRLAGEVGGNKGENFLREAVYGGKRISPLAGIRQRDRNALVELRDHIEGEPVSKGLPLRDQAT